MFHIFCGNFRQTYMIIDWKLHHESNNKQNVDSYTDNGLSGFKQGIRGKGYIMVKGLTR